MGFEATDLRPRIGTLIETDVATLVSGVHAERIRALIEERGVLVFRGLDIDDDAQLAFTRTLGAVYNPISEPIYKISFDTSENAKADYNLGNFSWHIDRTDQDVPPFASILSAKRLSPWGGETEFANTYAAYDDLPDADKALVDRLKVVHRLASSFREMVPFPTDEQRTRWATHPDKVHPLVWHHRSGRRSLITSTSAAEIVGMDRAEGAALLARMMAWATRPDYVYVHEWRLGDMLMWDNTGVMHRVRRYDLDAGRLLHRTTVAGDEPFDPAFERRAA